MYFRCSVLKACAARIKTATITVYGATCRHCTGCSSSKCYSSCTNYTLFVLPRRQIIHTYFSFLSSLHLQATTRSAAAGAANLMRWHENYAFNNSTLGRDLFKLIAMVIQRIPVPGLHESVSIVSRSFYGGAVYVVMTNPEDVARFLGLVVPAKCKQTLTNYLYSLMRLWGCIFHCLSDGFYRVTN